jgi:hypothetical protein
VEGEGVGLAMIGDRMPLVVNAPHDRGITLEAMRSPTSFT